MFKNIRDAFSNFLAIFGTLILGLALTACSNDWEQFRHDSYRTGHQMNESPLSDPAQVSNLAVAWTWQMPVPANTTTQRRWFRASPVVDNNRLFIGGGDGYFYALNATTGALLWQYPLAGDPPLLSQFTCNPSSRGIASSASITKIGTTEVVIFGAPDQSVGTGLGEGRLFALNAATGAEVWKSPVLAQIDGLTSGNMSQHHEQIGYSAPLVFDDKVYIGIANHCDNPIQQGQIKAVDLATGNLVAGFKFVGAEGPSGARALGGGVWTSVSAGNSSLYVTTGNISSGNPGGEPPVNNALAMLRLDKDLGDVLWKLQPVPFEMDGDPDWAAGATIMPSTSCGVVAASTMKDGWTYAVDAGTLGSTPPAAGATPLKWQFPPTGQPFSPGDGTDGLHGDIRFLRQGAAWGSVFITMAGGYPTLNAATRTQNYGRLHAFNVCAGSSDRIRWIKDIPNATSGTYRLGPPTVTRGIVYIGTTTGHLVAIADPSLFPAAGWRCTNPDVPTASCVGMGYTLIPDPAVLVDVTLDGRILTEPVIVRGKLYVATEAGKVYMLEP